LSVQPSYFTSDLQGFITPHKFSVSQKETEALIGGSAYLATYIKKEKLRAKEQGSTFFISFFSC